MLNIERNAIQRITKKLKKELGADLISVIAFGSRIRGDFNSESDFDILVVVKKRDFSIIEKVVKIFSNEEDKTNIPFSPVIKSFDIFNKEMNYNTTFYRNLKKDGVPFYGRT